MVDRKLYWCIFITNPATCGAIVCRSICSLDSTRTRFAEEFPRILAGGSSAWFSRALDVPAFRARAADARLISALYPASPTELRGFFRQSFGCGWALAGDAGYHAHPAPANGIADALRSAELLHSAVEKAWTRGEPAESRLADYVRIRDRENAGPYAYSYKLGSVNPFRDPDILSFITGLAHAGAMA